MGPSGAPPWLPCRHRHDVTNSCTSAWSRFTQMLQGLDEGDARALHQTRVASRRLREMLPVLQVEPGSRVAVGPASPKGHTAARGGPRARCPEPPDRGAVGIRPIRPAGHEARRGVCRRGPEARARPSAREASRRRTAPHRRQAWPHRRRSEDEQEDRPRLALGGRRARDAPGARAQDGAGRGRCDCTCPSGCTRCASRSRSCGMRTKWPPRPVGST